MNCATTHRDGGFTARSVAGDFLTDIWIVFAIIAGVIGLFVWDRLPVIAVCVGCAMALWATGILSLNQALAGFGDPATIFVTSLFVVSGALEKTGLTAWTGQMLALGSGASRTRLIVLMMLFCGVLSALISVNGAVAALLPVVVVLAVRLKRPPSQLLMPLVFGAHAGSMLALTGTPVNVLVLEASLDAGRTGLRLLRVRLRRRFPGDRHHRSSRCCSARASCRCARTGRCRPTSAAMPARWWSSSASTTACISSASGRSRRWSASRAAELDLGDAARRHPPDAAGGARAAARRGSGRSRPATSWRCARDAEAVAELAAELVLSPADAEGVKFEAGLFTTASGLAEVVIPPRSPLIGERLFPGMVTPSGNLVVLAIHRQHHDLPAGEALEKGDTLLLQGTWDALETYIAPPEALVVDSPELVRRQVAPMGREALISLGIMAVMVLLLATGLVPAAAAGILAAGAILIFGILNAEEIYRAIDWTTVILVGAMMPLSTAITETGAAQAPRRGAHLSGRRLRAAGAARRALRPDRRSRPGHLQHRHRAHHHPDLGGGRDPDGPLAAAGPDVRRRRRRGRLPDAGGDADQPHGDGAGRLPLRRLLEVRAADDALVLRHRRRAGAGHLAVLICA